MRLPLTQVGIRPRPGLKLGFNIGLRRMECGEWVMLTGTGGPTFDLGAAGMLSCREVGGEACRVPW